MLPGEIVATPQPALISVSFPEGGPPGGRPGRGPAARGPPKPKPPNIISTGTFSLASLGVVNVIAILTSIVGHAELSTTPCSCFSTTGTSPTIVSRVSTTFHATAGTCWGIRPYPSRSKSSTISGRRCFHHCSEVVTASPLLSASTLGRLGY